MKTKTTALIGLIILFCCATRVDGQITSERKGFKTTYSQDGQVIDSKTLVSLLKTDPSSQDAFQLSKTLSYVSLGMYAGFAVLEGLGLYYTIKESQALDEGDWDAQEEYEKKSFGAMGAGLACLLVGVPIGLISNSQFKKSIKLYNSSHAAGSMNDVSLNVVFIGSGVGVQVKF